MLDAARVNANKVFEGWGKGPETFSRKLTTDPNPTVDSVVTHWLFADSSTSVDDVAKMQAFAHGDLPPCANGGAWGVDGLISEADGIIAIDSTSFQCYTASGDVTPSEHVAGILLSRSLNWVPSEI